MQNFAWPDTYYADNQLNEAIAIYDKAENGR